MKPISLLFLSIILVACANTTPSVHQQKLIVPKTHKTHTKKQRLHQATKKLAPLADETIPIRNLLASNTE